MNIREKLQIRNAYPTERAVVREITLAAYAQYAALMPHWEEYRRHVLAILEEDQTADWVVAGRQGAVVGSVLLYPASAQVYETQCANSGAPEIRLLAVAPAARGMGVGSALLDECIRRTRNSCAGALTLHTEDIMEAALRMYGRKGFVRAPALDFSPAGGVLVKGYRLSLDEP